MAGAMPPAGPTPPDPASTIDPERVLRNARAKFVAAFPRQIERVRRLLDSDPAGRELRQLVHRMAGFAGTIGLPGVSAIAAALEAVLAGEPGADPRARHRARRRSERRLRPRPGRRRPRGCTRPTARPTAR